MNDSLIDKAVEMAAKERQKHKRAEQPSKEVEVITIDDLLNLPETEKSWLVSRFVLKSGITTVSGLPSHFKSLFVQNLCVSVSSGSPFLDTFECEKNSVLVIDREIPPIRLKNRWRSLGNLSGLPIYFYSYDSRFRLDDEDIYYKLKSIVKKHNIGLVVIDTFNRSHSGKEINSANEVIRLFEPLKRLISDVSIILIHHSGKKAYSKEVPTPEELLGSTDFMAETDSLFTLRKRSETNISVHNLKSRDSELLKAFEIELSTSSEDFIELTYKGDYVPKKPQSIERQEKIIEILKKSKGKLRRTELLSKLVKLGGNKGTIGNDLTKLKKRGAIDSEIKGKEAYYFLIDSHRVEESFIDNKPPREVKQLNIDEKTEDTVNNTSRSKNETPEDIVEVAKEIFEIND